MDITDGFPGHLSTLFYCADVPYIVSGRNPAGQSYEYTLNVCVNSSVPCGTAPLSAVDANFVACQRDTSSNVTFGIGRFDQQLLRYDAVNVQILVIIISPEDIRSIVYMHMLHTSVRSNRPAD